MQFNNSDNRQQHYEQYNPNQCTDKGFPHEQISKALERVYGYRDGNNNSNHVFDFRTWFNNQLGDLVDAVVDAAIMQHHTRNEWGDDSMVQFSYTFNDQYTWTKRSNNDNLTNSILNGFGLSTIHDFLMIVGVEGESINIGEITNVQQGHNQIIISFSYVPSKLLVGMEVYSNKLRADRAEEDFRKAVSNINTILVPQLDAIHKLSHNLCDIDKIFNMVTDLHATFVKPKDK